MSRYIDFARQLLSEADITLNGDQPHDIQIHNESCLRKIIRGGSLALGETYMEGDWDSEQLDTTMTRIMSARLEEKVSKIKHLPLLLKTFLINPQSKERAFIVGEEHYDIGNDVYECWMKTWFIPARIGRTAWIYLRRSWQSWIWFAKKSG